MGGFSPVLSGNMSNFIDDLLILLAMFNYQRFIVGEVGEFHHEKYRIFRNQYWTMMEYHGISWMEIVEMLIFTIFGDFYIPPFGRTW